MTGTHVKFVTCHRTLSIIVTLLLITSYTGARRSGGHTSSGGRHSSHGSSGSHSYPHSTGLSGTGAGSHTYPQSTSLSGNNYNYGHQQQNHQQQQRNQANGHKTEIHHHHHQYHYSPPSHVTYGAASYPVYHGQPPVYVYKYRDSGSRFGDLLTGLALYNLGRMSAHNHHYYNERREYAGTTGEICKLGVRKSNGDYEESRVDCQLMSSFIWDSEIPSLHHNNSQRTSVSVVNVTQVHSSGGLNDSLAGANGYNITTISVTNTTVVDALQAKGESIQVTPGMTCYMIRQLRNTSMMKKTIECGVLQTYARNSWRPNASDRIHPSYCFAVSIAYQMLLVYVF